MITIDNEWMNQNIYMKKKKKKKKINFIYFSYL
jgi:hypothetical protein